MNEPEKQKWIDISVSIQDAMVHWPGDTSVEIKRKETIDENNVVSVTSISMSAHTATHVDAPLHFIKNGKDITQLSLEVLIGPAKVFLIEDKEQISLHEIKDFPIYENDRVLFKTVNSEIDWAMKDFKTDYVFLASDAAAFLQSRNVLCVGIDYLSIAGKINGTKVHQMLLGSGICIIEGLNLKEVEPGDFDMICLPLKIKDADGAPARVVLKRRN